MTVYIYALCDPDSGDIYYVGSSIDPSYRIYSHRADAKYKTTPKGAWIAALIASGRKPAIEILDIADLNSRYEVEWAWILWLLSEGCGLTNKLPMEWKLG